MNAVQTRYTYGSKYSEASDADQQIKILIIDDNRDLANILCSLLNHLDYRAFVAFDEKQAMEKIRRIKPDLVFCDVGLPNRGAYKIAYKVRTDFLLSHIFLVGLTYSTQEKFKLIAMELGFDSYMSKPIQSSILGDILNKVEIRKAESIGKLCPIAL